MKKILKFSFIRIYIIFLNIFIFTYLSNISLAEENIKINQEFKSLKSDDANMRVGPASTFEILWNFKKRDLPIKIHKKFNHWYQVETPDGSIGWMWRNLIQKKKTIIFLKDEKIYKSKNEKSRVIANVDKNSILKIYSVKINGVKWNQKNIKF